MRFKNGLKAEPVNIKVIQNVQRVIDAKTVLRFTGAIGYLRCFLPNLSHVILLLQNLTKTKHGMRMRST